MSEGMRASTVIAVAVLAASLLALVVVAKPATAATLPPGFVDEQVAPVNKPIALAVTPDGRMLIATQPG
jgi:hypothetical protein